MEKKADIEPIEVNFYNLEMHIKILRSYIDVSQILQSKNDFHNAIKFGQKAAKIYSDILSFIKNNNLLQKADIEILEQRFSKKTELADPKFQVLEKITELNKALGLSFKSLAEEYLKNDKLEECLEMSRCALLYYPDDVFVNYNLANVLNKYNAKAEAADSYEAVCRLDKNYIYGKRILGELYGSKELRKLDKAVENYSEYNKKTGGDESSWGNCSCHCFEAGFHKECEEASLKTLEFNPSSATGLISYLLNLLQMDGYTQKQIKEITEKLAENAIKKLNIEKNIFSFDDINTDINRKIRLGYLSSDLNNHVVSNFFLPIVKNHDRSKFDINLYMTSKTQDSVSEEYKQHSDSFIDCSDMSLKQIADKIHEDKIDILIDLNIYSGNSKLFALAYKPAPIQCVYMGYPNTSGLDTVDYILTDKNTISEGEDDLYTETPAYIDAGYEIYSFDKVNPPDITPMVYDKNGYITVGIFNKPGKITETMLHTWAKILKARKKTKIIFQYIAHYTDKKRAFIRSIFKSHGVAEDRIEFKQNKETHFQNMLSADIALDAFPYTGTGTTMDSLLMGLPVVCLEGFNSSSRPSSRILKSVNEDWLIAKNLDEYIKKAIHLIDNPNLIRNFRFRIRDELKKSKLNDHAGFTKSIENTYKKMWDKYCLEHNK